MEQHKQPIGGFDPTQPESVSGDELAIRLGIEAARAEDREVSDAVARAIAAQLHGGRSTAGTSYGPTDPSRNRPETPKLKPAKRCWSASTRRA